MVDLGFEDYVRRVLLAIPNSNMKATDDDGSFRQELEAKAGHRQYRITQMFSATMPPVVERLARQFLRCAVFISVGDPGHAKKTSISVWNSFRRRRRKSGWRRLWWVQNLPSLFL